MQYQTVEYDTRSTKFVFKLHQVELPTTHIQPEVGRVVHHRFISTIETMLCDPVLSVNVPVVPM